MSQLRSLALLVPLLVTLPAFADAPPAPALVHVQIVDAAAGERQTADHAVLVVPDGDSGTIDVGQPGAEHTHLKVRLSARGTPTVEFDVEHVAADKSYYTARGELARPPLGKPVEIARLPTRAGEVEIRLTLTAPR